jgi:hypothetical protein
LVDAEVEPATPLAMARLALHPHPPIRVLTMPLRRILRVMPADAIRSDDFGPEPAEPLVGIDAELAVAPLRPPLAAVECPLHRRFLMVDTDILHT